MTPRLFVEAPLAEGGAAALPAEQAHYLRNVLRLAEGASILVFNESDGEYAARIETLTKKSCALRVAEKRRACESGPDLWLIVAAVKRAALETIVQKATELGASKIIPAATARANAARLNIQRLQAIAVEASEQCGRLSVPRLAALAPLADILANWPSSRRLLFCDEAGDDPAAEWGGRVGRAAPVLDALRDAGEGPWAILIGPEGGFAPDERARLRALPYVKAATLGPRILRADTAAIAALVLWQAALGDLARS